MHIPLTMISAVSMYHYQHHNVMAATQKQSWTEYLHEEAVAVFGTVQNSMYLDFEFMVNDQHCSVAAAVVTVVVVVVVAACCLLPAAAVGYFCCLLLLLL